jgi:hypothetical protein
MSTATLHYTDLEMVWECATILKNEKFADTDSLGNVQIPNIARYPLMIPLK